MPTTTQPERLSYKSGKTEEEVPYSTWSRMSALVQNDSKCEAASKVRGGTCGLDKPRTMEHPANGRAGMQISPGN